MNDERFKQDLTVVLREIAGKEAPVSLRYRLTDVTEHAPARMLWFSPPLRLAAATVVVVAIAALAIIFVPRQLVGQSPSGSPEPSATPVPTASLGASASAEATSSAEPTMTPVPTPGPTPVLSSWSGIGWTDPFEPFPYQPPVYTSQKGTSTYLNAILPWNGGFVAAGSISHGFQCEEATFLRSDDGVNWTITARFSSGDQFAFYMCPEYLLSTPDGLVAVGQQRIWSSTDGVAWTEMESPSWRAFWPSGSPQLVDVASGRSGLVAIGLENVQPSGVGDSVVVHSTDGRVWERVDLPAEEQAIVRDLAAYRGGYVIVGRDGQPDSNAGMQLVTGAGRAAAWTSPDGVAWTEAAVQADRVRGGVLTQLLVGSNGLFAVGINSGSELYPSVDYAAGAVVTAWASADGSSWELAGAMGADLPPMGMLASDGTTMIGLGLRQTWVGQDPTAWASVDGFHWTALAVSGPSLDVSYLGLEQQLLPNPHDTALWVLPDGLLALGAGDGVPLNQAYASQWFRFAAATR